MDYGMHFTSSRVVWLTRKFVIFKAVLLVSRRSKMLATPPAVTGTWYSSMLRCWSCRNQRERPVWQWQGSIDLIRLHFMKRWGKYWKLFPWEKQGHGVDSGHIFKLTAYGDEMRSFMDIREQTNQKVNETSKASRAHEHFESYSFMVGLGGSCRMHLGCSSRGSVLTNLLFSWYEFRNARFQ